MKWFTFQIRFIWMWTFHRQQIQLSIFSMEKSSCRRHTTVDTATQQGNGCPVLQPLEKQLFTQSLPLLLVLLPSWPKRNASHLRKLRCNRSPFWKAAFSAHLCWRLSLQREPYLHVRLRLAYCDGGWTVACLNASRHVCLKHVKMRKRHWSLWEICFEGKLKGFSGWCDLYPLR